MPCLIPEILFEIGRKIVEEGSQEDVYKFAFSGRETYEALAQVFATVTTLKLYKNSYTIGWGDNCRDFEFRSGQPHSNYLLHCIGYAVQKLHVDAVLPLYQPVLDKIISRKQLIDFSTIKCSQAFLDKFLPLFSTTLVHVTIPSSKMTKNFRDLLHFQLVTVPIRPGMKLGLFCCRTVALEITEGGVFLEELEGQASNRVSPALSSIQKIIFNNTVFHPFFTFDNGFVAPMRYFPSLGYIKSNITQASSFDRIKYQLTNNVTYFAKYVQRSVFVPSKITCQVFNCEEVMKDVSFEELRQLCTNFRYDRFALNCHRFYLYLRSAGPKSTLLELLFFE